MQVNPIKPTLKTPGTKRLKLENDDLLSSFAFKFNLRRYTMGQTAVPAAEAQVIFATTPVFNAAISVAFLGESVGQHTLLGGGVIIAASVLPSAIDWVGGLRGGGGGGGGGAGGGGGGSAGGGGGGGKLARVASSRALQGGDDEPWGVGDEP